MVIPERAPELITAPLIVFPVVAPKIAPDKLKVVAPLIALELIIKPLIVLVVVGALIAEEKVVGEEKVFAPVNV